MTEQNDEASDLGQHINIKAGPLDEDGRTTITITLSGSAEAVLFERFLVSRFVLGAGAGWKSLRDPVRLQKSPQTLDLIASARLKLTDAWVRAISVYGLVSVGELSERVGTPWVETEETLNELALDGVLLSIAVGGIDSRDPVVLFPAFQFDGEGRVLPVMAQISARMTRNWDVEAKLLWLTSPSGWLVNRAPADLLETSPDAVVRALDLTVGAA